MRNSLQRQISVNYLMVNFCFIHTFGLIIPAEIANFICNISLLTYFQNVPFKSLCILWKKLNAKLGRIFLFNTTNRSYLYMGIKYFLKTHTNIFSNLRKPCGGNCISSQETRINCPRKGQMDSLSANPINTGTTHPELRLIPRGRPVQTG